MTMQGIEANGTNGSDLVLGTEFSDRLTGRGDGGDNGNDTIRGLAGDDFFLTSRGADLIEGGNGNDRFDVEFESADQAFGVDTLLGGEGDDTFFLKSERNDDPPQLPNAWTIDGGDGIDKLVAFGGTETVVFDLETGEYGRPDLRHAFAGIENVTIFAPSDLSGNDANNLFLSSGRSTARGRGGDDTIIGGDLPADFIPPDDSLDGGDRADSLVGNAGFDVLIGGNGEDTLDGGRENDRLLGGNGDDDMRGDVGVDLLDGGAGGDRYSGGRGADVFRFSGGAGNDTIDDFSRDDGDKIFILANVNDTGIASFSALQRSSDSSATYLHLGESGGVANLVVVLGVSDLRESDIVFGTATQEIVSNGTDGSDLIVGTESSDTLAGGSNGADIGNDTIRGFGGDDFLRTSPGSDLIEGGPGNDYFDVEFERAALTFGVDTLLGGEGDDIFNLNRETPFDAPPLANAWFIDGGDGIDTLFADDSTRIVVVDLSTGVYRPPGANRSFTDIENVIIFAQSDLNGDDGDNLFASSGRSTAHGRGGDDTIFGGSNHTILEGGNNFIPPYDSLDGGDGDDWLIGNSGDDTLIGGNGGDVLFASDGHDLLLGGNGSDNLLGEDHNDTLDGGADGDGYFGGPGTDLFRFVGGSGLDAIYDFNRAEGDKIEIAANVNGTGIASFSALPRFSDPLATYLYLGESGSVANWVVVLGVSEIRENDIVFA